MIAMRNTRIMTTRKVAWVFYFSEHTTRAWWAMMASGGTAAGCLIADTLTKVRGLDSNPPVPRCDQTPDPQAPPLSCRLHVEMPLTTQQQQQL